MITHITQSPTPRHTGADVNGYGAAVAIGWKVRTHGAGPWRRLRVASYGNAGGTPEYVEDGASRYVDDDTLAALEIAREDRIPDGQWSRDIARNYASPGSIGATLAQFATTGTADHLELVEDIRATLADIRRQSPAGLLPLENVDLWHLLAYALTR